MFITKLHLIPSRFEKMTMKGYYTILFLLFTIGVFAQNKRLQQKANDLYKNEQYAEAIPLYEQLLADGTTLNVKTKLANCYRVNNNLVAAEKLYADIVQDDKAKAITWFYYAETLMGNGKYESAKEWLEQYRKVEPDDERAALLIRACDEVPNIKPYFPYVYLKEFPYNSPADDNSAVIFNGQIIFSSDRKQGVKLLKQKSGWTGRDYLKLYSSLISEDWSKIMPAENYSSRLTDLNKNTGNATFTADGTEVFFTKNNNELSKRNAYNLQIFRAVSDGDEKWSEVEKLTFCSGEYNYMHPAISPDGKYLFFVSDKPRGEGGTDIYWTKRRDDGIWGKVQNLGTAINTSSHEGFPFFTKNGELFFCSKGHIGYGGFDIFFSRLEKDGTWTIPANLGKPINSSLDDISIYLNEKQTKGLFTSARANGDDDIYLFEIGRMPIAPQTPLATTNLPKDTTVAPRINNDQLLAELQKPADYNVPADTPSDLPKTTSIPSSIVTEVTEIDTQLIEEEQVIMQVDSAVQSSLIATTKLEEVANDVKIEEPESAAQKVENQSIEKEEVLSVVPAPPVVESVPLQRLTEQLTAQNYNFQQNITLSEISYASAAIEPNDYQTLNQLVTFLKKFPQVEIELGAHTTGDKEEATRINLTQKRAYSAAAYLVELGIASRRIVPRGYGSVRLGEEVLTIKILAF